MSVLCKWEGKERERGRIAGKEDLKKWLLLPLLHVQGKKNNVVPKRHRFVILFVFFFLEKRNEFRSNPKMGYDTRSHVNEVNSGPLKLSLFEYIVL